MRAQRQIDLLTHHKIVKYVHNSKFACKTIYEEENCRYCKISSWAPVGECFDGTLFVWRSQSHLSLFIALPFALSSALIVISCLEK